jgi:Tol biopolymer transport system component
MNKLNLPIIIIVLVAASCGIFPQKRESSQTARNDPSEYKKIYSPDGMKVIVYEKPLDLKISRWPLNIGIFCLGLFVPRGVSWAYVPDRLYVQSVDGSDKERYPFDYGPPTAWSPDSKKIFVGDNEKPAIIFVEKHSYKNIAERRKYLKTHLAYAIEKAEWSADGKSVSFLQGNKVFMYDIKQELLSEIAQERAWR